MQRARPAPDGLPAGCRRTDQHAGVDRDRRADGDPDAGSDGGSHVGRDVADTRLADTRLANGHGGQLADARPTGPRGGVTGPADRRGRRACPRSTN